MIELFIIANLPTQYAQASFYISNTVVNGQMLLEVTQASHVDPLRHTTHQL